MCNSFLYALAYEKESNFSSISVSFCLFSFSEGISKPSTKERPKVEQSSNDHFIYYFLRVENLTRWHVFNNIKYENVAEHSFETAIIAMTLSYISNAFYGGNFNAEHLAILALFHDYPETITGDIISPIHYNSNVAKGFEKLEEEIMENLVGQIPEPFKEKFSSYINSQKEDEKTLKLLKAADKISALLKCLKEILMDLVKLKILLITELPYDEIIKKENWDTK